MSKAEAEQSVGWQRIAVSNITRWWQSTQSSLGVPTVVLWRHRFMTFIHSPADSISNPPYGSRHYRCAPSAVNCMCSYMMERPNSILQTAPTDARLGDWGHGCSAHGPDGSGGQGGLSRAFGRRLPLPCTVISAHASVLGMGAALFVPCFTTPEV